MDISCQTLLDDIRRRPYAPASIEKSNKMGVKIGSKLAATVLRKYQNARLTRFDIVSRDASQAD